MSLNNYRETNDLIGTVRERIILQTIDQKGKHFFGFHSIIQIKYLLISKDIFNTINRNFCRLSFIKYFIMVAQISVWNNFLFNNKSDCYTTLYPTPQSIY